MSALTRSCFLPQSWPQTYPKLDVETPSLITTSLICTTLDYCNSFFLTLLPAWSTDSQVIENAAAQAVSCSKQSHHITPVLSHSIGSKFMKEYFSNLSMSHSMHYSSGNPPPRIFVTSSLVKNHTGLDHLTSSPLYVLPGTYLWEHMKLWLPPLVIK